MEAVSAWVNEIVLHEVDLPRATPARMSPLATRPRIVETHTFLGEVAQRSAELSPVSPAMEAEVSTAYCGGCSTSRSHLGYHASQRCSSNRQRRGDLASMDRREAMGRRHEIPETIDRIGRPLMA